MILDKKFEVVKNVERIVYAHILFTDVTHIRVQLVNKINILINVYRAKNSDDCSEILV